MSLRQGACILGKVRRLFVVFSALRCFTDALVGYSPRMFMVMTLFQLCPNRFAVKHANVKGLWAIGLVGRLTPPSQGILLAMCRIMS